MIKPNSEVLSKSQLALSKSKNSRFQFLKDNLSKASSSIKSKFEKMFSYNNELEELENELKMNEEQNNSNDQYDDYDNEYNYEEVQNKNSKKVTSKSSKDDENYIYVAENGDLHYVDQEGNVFKCREEDGDVILEEQIFSVSKTASNKATSKSSMNHSKSSKHKHKKYEDSDDDDDPELNSDELFKNDESIEIDEDPTDDGKKEVIFEELVFVRNEFTPSGEKGKNITKSDSKLERIHKLRDKGELIEFTTGPLFKATKPNQKSMKIIQLIKQKVTRYIGVDEAILYVLSKDKKKYKVRSHTNILSIRKILESNDKALKIEISDINKPDEEISIKVYDFEKRNDFLINLKSIFQRHGIELKIISF